MKIWLLMASALTFAACEYPRFKLRPPPPRSSHQYSHAKKWQQQPQPQSHHHHHQHQPQQQLSQASQRQQTRVRPPIPVHMPPQHKIPMGVPYSLARPVSPPVRTFWKNTQTTYRPPLDKKKPHHHHTHLPEKTAFLSSPSINAQEYDFHLQTNAIPNNIHTIKQVGEKGPIHTIPAPNLSLADRPVIVEEVKHVQQHNPDTTSYVQIQKAHQYHVTEAPEQSSQQKFYRNNQQHEKHTQVVTTSYQTNVPQEYHGVEQQQQQQQLSQKELYDILNSYPQQQQVQYQSQAGYLQQQYPNYEMLFAQTPQLFQPEQQNYEQAGSQQAADKVSLQPEYHSFNYEEQANKDVAKKELSSLVTANYNLEPQAEASEPIHATLHRNSVLDSMAQSQYVQNYFDTREESVNHVEPDAKPSEKTMMEKEPVKEEEQDDGGFYVSLPNKQTADSLASLQAAGKVNSNLMHLANKPALNKVPSYQADDDKQENEGNESRFKIEEEYDDYSQEQEGFADQINEGFGHKLNPKRS